MADTIALLEQGEDIGTYDHIHVPGTVKCPIDLIQH
jgi:hypothetical protein